MSRACTVYMYRAQKMVDLWPSEICPIFLSLFTTTYHCIFVVRVWSMCIICMSLSLTLQNKKRGCNVSQLLYCMLGHALQHKQDMFGVFCDQDRVRTRFCHVLKYFLPVYTVISFQQYQPWLVKRRDDVLRFYEGPWLSGLQGLLDVHMLMWQYVTAQHSTTD